MFHIVSRKANSIKTLQNRSVPLPMAGEKSGSAFVFAAALPGSPELRCFPVAYLHAVQDLIKYALIKTIFLLIRHKGKCVNNHAIGKNEHIMCILVLHDTKHSYALQPCNSSRLKEELSA